MPPPPERLVEEAARALGLEVHPEWRPAVAEHLRRLFEAAEAMEGAGLAPAEPATKFEP